MNTDSVLETLKELRRWEQTTTSIESKIREVQGLRGRLQHRLRSLELTLSAMEEDLFQGSDDSAGGGA